MYGNSFFVLSLIIILTEGGVLTHDPFYCYSQDPIRPQIGMFGMYTAYETRRGQSINPNASTCNPSKFWMLGRHATRMPYESELIIIFENNERLQKEILSNYDKGKTSLCASDVELIKNWKFDPNITLEDGHNLTTAGWNEMKGIAQRYQAAFPSILSSTYTPSDYFFRSTNFKHTQDSLRAFGDGLFGVNGHESIQFEDIPEKDYLLEAHLQCPLHSELTANVYEKEAFREMPEYEQMHNQVSSKLGFHGSHTLRRAEIETLGMLCRYEQTWNLNSTSPFCAAFSIANHQVLEYEMNNGDLNYYYRHGFGLRDYRRLFENFGCFLIQDMLRFLQSNNVNDHKARIFNARIPPYLNFFVNLGLFEDNIPLTRHNFAQQAQRLWRLSLIAPMAGNVVVIRYDCADGDNDILFLLNEEPLQIAGCDPNGVCKQSLIIERFRRFLDADCVEIFCTNS